MERATFDPEMRCAQCLRACDSAEGWLTIGGFLCQSCTDWLDGKKRLSHQELLAVLHGELAYVRGQPWRILEDRMERIH